MAGFHSAYYGVTQSGKTTLARAFARKFSEAGAVVVVYDPVGTITAGGGWPDNAILFDDPDELLAFVEDEHCPACLLFIDEASDIFGHTLRDNFWLATRGRHFHIYLHVITQRPNLIHPTVRNQMGKMYVFRLANEDMKAVFADAGQNGAKEIDLDAGDFLVLTSGAREYQRGNVFKLLEGNKSE